VIGDSQEKGLLNKFITDLYNYEKYSCPFKEGDKYYYFYNPGLLAQRVLYQQDSLTAKGTSFFDANQLSKEGTTALSTFEFSKSGKYFAHGLSFNGSDWVTIQVQDAKGVKLSDKIEWAKFTGISWTHDDKGFFYTRYPKPNFDSDNAGTETSANLNSKVYYHTLGTSQEKDVLVYEDPVNPSFMLSGSISDDGNYLLITISDSCMPVNKVYIQSLQGKSYQAGSFVKVVDHMKGEFRYIANDDSVFYFKTNLDALRYKIVKYDLSLNKFYEHIPETESVLDSAFVAHQNKLILVYMKNVMNAINVHDLQSGVFKSNIPIDIGSVDSGNNV
jgi:prolyl oligopeptidase